MSIRTLVLSRRARIAQANALERQTKQILAGIKAQADVIWRGWRGAWDAEIEYKAGESVEHDGSSFIALVDNKGEKPAEGSTTWDLIAQRGKQGKPGKPGKDGEVRVIHMEGGGGSGGTDLSRLPVSADLETPEEFIVKQNGEWVRVTYAQMVSWLGGGGVVTPGQYDVVVEGVPMTIGGVQVVITGDLPANAMTINGEPLVINGIQVKVGP